MSFFVRAALAAVVTLIPIYACGGSGSITYAGDGGPDAGFDVASLGGGVGAACSDASPCRPGLACNSGTCAPGHNLGDGAPCVISDECKPGDYCGPQRTCAASGSGATGASCTSDGDCASGLRCNIVGFGAQCQAEGSNDVGGKCATGADCFGGLACVAGSCSPLPPGPISPLAVPTWKGVDCADDPGAPTAYFRVPRGTGDGDFFRLPFPNDVRRGADGHPTLSGFPTPGPEILGYDVVDRYVKDVETTRDGFGAYGTVIMRFSAPIDFESLKGQNVIRWVELPAGTDQGLSWAATTGRSAYVCSNAIYVRPSRGEALKPGSTYAVVVSNGAKAPGGGAIQRSPDLIALLGASAPGDAALTNAYAAYKPLRDWASAKSVDPSTIVNAAVFTVGHTTDPATKLAAAATSAPLATATGWVKCGSGPSPCPDTTGDRACGAADPAFDELHALVSLPIFQKGTAPYLTPADGGDVDVTVQRNEQVCLSLTVPKSTMPAAGWPLVVYAHGTGGSFRSAITEGVAKSLASVDDGAGGTVAMAVLGIDQVQHGPRRNGSTASPNDLFYNFANPGAARGNPLQGAMDQIALVRFAKSLSLLGAASPTGSDIKVGSVMFFGHSQGATEGAIMAPYATGFTGMVVSGEGASLIDALLHKTSPVNIAAAVPFVLEESSPVNDTHPVLSLLQDAIDPADPLVHARAIAAVPTAPGMGKHVFMPYGQKDTYAPSETQITFVLAAQLGLASPPASVTAPDDIGGLTPAPVPAKANLAQGVTTGFVREYTPAGFDGHFVVFQDATAQKDAAHFLADLALGKTPAVGR
jgi:hypothetical protein